MTAQSATSAPATSTDSSDATFSQALAAGNTHCGWLVGQKGGKCGQEAVLASHSVRPETVEELRTRGTYGPLFAGSSPSDDQQRSLANKLRQAMDVNGSPEYSMTWKRWTIGFREPICALRASARPIFGSGCTGWPTPMTASGGPESAERKRELGRLESGGGDLQAAAQMAGWATATVNDFRGGLNQTANRSNADSQHHDGQTLVDQANLAGWNTTRATDGEKGGPNQSGGSLPNDAAKMASGSTPTTSTAQTTNGGQLNPRMSCWLMGYPVEWLEVFLQPYLKE